MTTPNPPSPNEALREALDLVFRIEAAGVIMCEAENFERWKETARRIAPTLREADADAYGRTGEREDCFACNGSGQEYGETCLTCGGFGWTRLDAPSLSPLSGEPASVTMRDRMIEAQSIAACMYHRDNCTSSPDHPGMCGCGLEQLNRALTLPADHIEEVLGKVSGEPASVVVEADKLAAGALVDAWYALGKPALTRDATFIIRAFERHRSLPKPTPASVAGEVEVLPSNLAEIIEAEMKAWKGANGGIYAIHACALGVSIALRSALSKPTPVEAGLREGDATLYDMDGYDVQTTFVRYVEGWCEVAFRDKSTAIVRPSRIRLAALSENLPPPSQE